MEENLRAGSLQGEGEYAQCRPLYATKDNIDDARRYHYEGGKSRYY